MFARHLRLSGAGILASLALVTGTACAQVPHCTVSRARLYESAAHWQRIAIAQQARINQLEAARRPQAGLLGGQIANSPLGLLVPNLPQPIRQGKFPAEPERRTPPVWERRAVNRRENRQRSLDHPDWTLQGIGNRPNAERLNDYLVVLRTLDVDDFEIALASNGAGMGIERDRLRDLRWRASGGGPISRPDDRQVLEPRWPRLLRSPEFSDARRRFDEAVNGTRRSVDTNGEASYRDEDRLRDAVTSFQSEFVLAFPKSRRLSSSAAFHEYRVASTFLDDLQLRVEGLGPDDPSISEPRPALEGDTVGEIVEHMIENDLTFAAAEHFDRGTYERMYLGMRGMVLAPDEDDEVDEADAAGGFARDAGPPDAQPVALVADPRAE